MKRRRQFHPDMFPLPDYLQWAVERNIGRSPVWKFPPMPPSPEGLTFEKLDFETRHLMHEMFENDPDEWVDERFKTAQGVYEYVALLCIEMPFSWKRGGCDWLVFTPENECAGVLHMFEFSRERFSHNHRKCAVGFAFAQKFRGTGLPEQALRHFQNYLFQKMDRLYLVAWAETANTRSCRFLEKLGWLDRTVDYSSSSSEPKERFFELYRTTRTRAAIERKRADWDEKERARKMAEKTA